MAPWIASQLHHLIMCYNCLQERRIAQQREVFQKERETVQKIAARAYTQQYLSGLLPTVFTSLRTHGYFHDPVERGQPCSHGKHNLILICLHFFALYFWFPDIESNFLPWLMSEVNNCLKKRNAARQLLDSKIQQHIHFTPRCSEGSFSF